MLIFCRITRGHTSSGARREAMIGQGGHENNYGLPLLEIGKCIPDVDPLPSVRRDNCEGLLNDIMCINAKPKE